MKFTLAALVAGLLANQQPQPNHDMSKISFTQSDCYSLLGFSRFPEEALRRNKQQLQYEEIMEQLDCQTYIQQKDQKFEEFRKREIEKINEWERKKNAQRAKFEPEFKARQCANYLYYRETDTQNNGYNLLSQHFINSLSSTDAYQENLQRCKWLAEKYNL